MKNLIILAAIVFSTTAFSQVIIGDDVGGSATNKTSVLLEFANQNNRGIILPYVRDTSGITTEGSIILDASSATNARVKFKNGATNTDWVDLSGQGANVTSALTNQPTGIAEASATKTIIGAQSTAVNDGVLVLESSTKAMILPIVVDVNNIINPAPGMMVFVNKPGAKRLAVFNGAKWSFWLP